MQNIIFQLPVDQLDARFLESLKLLFKGQNIEIEVRPSRAKSSQYRLEERLSTVEEAKVIYEVSEENWDTLLEKASTDDAFNVVDAIRSFKSERA